MQRKGGKKRETPPKKKQKNDGFVRWLTFRVEHAVEFFQKTTTTSVLKLFSDSSRWLNLRRQWRREVRTMK